jgi:hypothetical protein
LQLRVLRPSVRNGVAEAIVGGVVWVEIWVFVGIITTVSPKSFVVLVVNAFGLVFGCEDAPIPIGGRLADVELTSALCTGVLGGETLPKRLNIEVGSGIALAEQVETEASTRDGLVKAGITKPAGNRRVSIAVEERLDEGEELVAGELGLETVSVLHFGDCVADPGIGCGRWTPTSPLFVLLFSGRFSVLGDIEIDIRQMVNVIHCGTTRMVYNCKKVAVVTDLRHEWTKTSQIDALHLVIEMYLSQGIPR